METYDTIDNAYQDLLEKILQEGNEKKNRTGVKTLSIFGHSFQIDISKMFPLLSLKDMGGNIFHSVVAELLWYLSGESHIKNLKEHTQIWDQWADEKDRLDFAYGRFWRRYPVPLQENHLNGETWPEDNDKYTNIEVNSEERERKVFDQIDYILDTLKENPFSRRMVLNAWHPANCAIANPPACHCMAIFNVESNGQILNCHLTMRSNDVGLGHPFNIAQYSLLTYLLAQQVGMEPGNICYSGTDVHLYMEEDEGKQEYDQIEYAEEIIQRDPKENPQIEIQKRDSIDDYQVDDFSLHGYEAHPYIGMKPVP